MSSGFDPAPSDRLEVTKEQGAALTDFDYRVMASILKMTHSLRWPKDTLSYLTEWMALEGLQVPVSQLSGFTGFTAQSAVVNTQEDTSSDSYTDLATVGPQLTALPNGLYIVLFGSGCSDGGSGAGTAVSLSANGAAASDTDRAENTGFMANVARGVVATLSSSDNNSLTMKYRRNGGVAPHTFRSRWLIALKYADL